MITLRKLLENLCYWGARRLQIFASSINHLGWILNPTKDEMTDGTREHPVTLLQYLKDALQ